MRFQTSGQFTQGQADVDPVAAPENILPAHVLPLPEAEFNSPATALWLALLGAGAETVTLDLYFLIDETDRKASSERFIDAGHRWFQFATGVVVTNGTLQQVAAGAGVPPGGVVYARRTADTIGAGETRPLTVAWI